MGLGEHVSVLSIFQVKFKIVIRSKLSIAGGRLGRFMHHSSKLRDENKRLLVFSEGIDCGCLNMLNIDIFMSLLVQQSELRRVSVPSCLIGQGEASSI